MKNARTLERDWDAVLDDPSGDIPPDVRAANILRALANPHRLKILRLLDEAPHNVMDICDRLGLRQSLASQHLARLRLDGVVAAKRQGHHVVYSLKNPMIKDILAVLNGEKTEPAPKAKARKRRANGGAAPESSRATT